MKTNKTEQNQEECEEVKSGGTPTFFESPLLPQKSLSHARFFFEFFRRAGEGGGGRGGERRDGLGGMTWLEMRLKRGLMGNISQHMIANMDRMSPV